jgi:hypothetical protein
MIITDAGGVAVPACRSCCTRSADHDLNDERMRSCDGSLLRQHVAGEAGGGRRDVVVDVVQALVVPDDGEPHETPSVISTVARSR